MRTDDMEQEGLNTFSDRVKIFSCKKALFVLLTLSEIAYSSIGSGQQYRSLPNPVGNEKDSVVVSDSSIVDGNAISPRAWDFTRFTVPGECVAAAERTTASARRAWDVRYQLSLLRDTAPERDTLPSPAVAVAQTCGRSFSVESIAPTDLPDLFTLALLEGNDRLAQSVVQRRLVLARDGQARQMVLADAVSGYLQAEPARLSTAEKIAAEADSLAVREHTNSLPAHEPLLEFARMTFNQSRMLQEARRIIDLGHTLSFASIQYTNVPIIHAWMRILEVAFFAQPDSVLVLAQQAKTDLKRFPVASMGNSDWPPGIPWVVLQAFNFSRATPVQVRNTLLPFNPNQYTDLQQLPPVNARYWFPSRPKIWPPQGQISLVLYGGGIMRCARSDYNLLVWPTRPGCISWQTSLQDWTKLYSNRGFSLIIVERTEGHAVRSGPLTPDEEADSLNWYYRTYLHLPATLAVVPQVVLRYMPQPDGRRLFADTTRFGHLLGDDNVAKRHGGEGLAMLFDRKGDLLFAGQFEQNQALVQALIRREFITSSRED